VIQATSAASPFRRWRHRIRQAKVLGKALKEESLEGTVTGASAVVFDSASTDDERIKAINEFIEDISKMSGDRFFAIAVAYV
jgi:hypothetical protein